jgi:osmoprotectant transport system permease protein
MIVLASVSPSSLAHWFTDGANWRGAEGLPHRLTQHVEISAVALAVACLVALPIGVLLGHAGRGGLLALNLANIGRAIPSLAILVVAVPLVGIGDKPAYVALIALAIPPILTNTYVGMREADRDARDAAKGMGMTSAQVMRRIELPLALPLILAGIRTSTFQVIATATLAAEVAAGGLGRYIVDGLATRDDTRVFAGALVVVMLALVVEALIATLQRALIAPPLRRPARLVSRSMEDTDYEVLTSVA